MSQVAAASSRAAGRSVRIGIALFLVAGVIFSAQDAISKVLARDYDSPQIIMVRFWAFGLFSVIYVSLRGGLGAAIRSRRPVLQVSRAILLIGEMMLFTFALRFLGLAESHALFATCPLLITALAVPILGEHVGWRRWLGVGIGFLGALVIIRPGLGVFHPAALLTVSAAVGFAVYNLLTRLVSFHDRFETSLLYMGVVGGVAASLVGVPVWRTPDAHGWTLLAILSTTGIAGHLMLIKALEFAPASLLQPFNYMMLVWATTIGFLVFGDLPDAWTIAGATMIVAGGAYVIWRERQIGRAHPAVIAQDPAADG